MKILWSIDAFESQDQQALGAVAQTIKNFQTGSQDLVYPAFVLSPAQMGLSADFDVDYLVKYRDPALKALQHRVADFAIPGLQSGSIIPCGRASTSGTVEALIDYAVEQKMDCIAVTTHARSGVSRFLLGSFAESLIASSPIPVLLVGPHCSVRGKFKNIIFPTAFEEGSFAFFEKAVLLAKEWGAKVTLLHSLPHPYEPVFQSGVYLMSGGWVPVSQYIDDAQEEIIQAGHGWIDRVKHLGVKVDFDLRVAAAPVAEQILQLSHTHDQPLVMMSTHRGPFTALLLGSVTRQVLRSAECPLWIIRPELAELQQHDHPSERSIPA